MIAHETIQRFRRQMATMTSVARFLTTLGTTVPPVFTLVKLAGLSREEKERWASSVNQCAEFIVSLHPAKSLYVDDPSPVGVDPDVSSLAFSDHLQERLGKLHPFFDFIHAPFTHPLGTQFSLIFITYAWDAYDTYTDEVLQQCCAKIQEGDTDEKLRKVGLLPSNEEIAAEYDRSSGDRLIGAQEVPAVILAAKLLRNSFSHRGGDPMPKLRQMIEEKRFHQKLMRFLPGNQFEVVLPMARLVSDIIIAKVELIQAKAESTVGSDAGKV